jgi:hypothetical protein
MAALLAGALGGACGNSPPTDKNFGTNLGADFKAPIVDASSDGDTNVTPEASADGAGTGGTPSTGGTTGTGGGAGAAGQAGAGGAGGNAGAAGGGS